MDEKIKLYESLLNEKAALEKDCERFSLDYAREFGDEIQELFQLKVDSVTLKKQISYCVKKSYKNLKIYSNELEKYIDAEIIDYQRRLAELIEFNEFAKDKGTPITFDEMRKIKKRYYEIVHLIHPDLHPEFKDNEEILILWDEAVDAYKSNDYKSLSEVYFKVYLRVKPGDIVIEDIDNKIEVLTDEISEIKNNEPYTYKFILDNEEEVNAYHDRLKEEIKDYKDYKESLEKELSKFEIIEGCDA